MYFRPKWGVFRPIFSRHFFLAKIHHHVPFIKKKRMVRPRAAGGVTITSAKLIIISPKYNLLPTRRIEFLTEVSNYKSHKLLGWFNSLSKKQKNTSNFRTCILFLYGSYITVQEKKTLGWFTNKNTCFLVKNKSMISF